jgi:hypothetical protein
MKRTKKVRSLNAWFRVMVMMHVMKMRVMVTVMVMVVSTTFRREP